MKVTFQFWCRVLYASKNSPRWMPMSSTPSGDLSACTLLNMEKNENKIGYVFCHQANLLKLWLNPRSDDNFVGGHNRRD